MAPNASVCELLTRRYEERSTVITTNKPFKEWNQVFPSSGVVVTLIDRLVHHSEIVKIAGKSYRDKEAKERAAERKEERAKRSRKKKGKREPSEAE